MSKNEFHMYTEDNKTDTDEFTNLKYKPRPKVTSKY